MLRRAVDDAGCVAAAYAPQNTNNKDRWEPRCKERLGQIRTSGGCQWDGPVWEGSQEETNLQQPAPRFKRLEKELSEQGGPGYYNWGLGV